MTRAGLQCAQMLCALGLGLSLGVIYDFYRIFLKKNHGARWCWLGDFLWWALALVWTFFLLVRISWAELRLPVVLAVFGGIIVYLYYFSPVLREIYQKAAHLLKKFCLAFWAFAAKIIRLIFAPIVFISSLLYKIVGGLLWFFRKMGGELLGFGKKTKSRKAAKRQKRRTDKAQQQAAKKRQKAEKQNSNKNNNNKKRRQKHRRNKGENRQTENLNKRKKLKRRPKESR